MAVNPEYFSYRLTQKLPSDLAELHTNPNLRRALAISVRVRYTLNLTRLDCRQGKCRVDAAIVSRLVGIAVRAQ